MQHRWQPARTGAVSGQVRPSSSPSQFTESETGTPSLTTVGVATRPPVAALNVAEEAVAAASAAATFCPLLVHWAAAADAPDEVAKAASSSFVRSDDPPSSG